MRKKKKNVFLYIVTFSWLFEGFVMFYKKCVSPLLPSVCRYYPTCSTYMLYSIKKHGAVKGVAFGAARLLRCQPWVKGGYDPIPEKKGDYKWLY